MEDDRIIALLWERSELALREIDRKYGRLCGAVAGNVLPNAQDAEECVSDALLAVWNAIPPARPDSLPAFLCRVVRSHALKKRRYNRAQKRDEGASLPIDELAACLSGGNATEDEVDAALLGQAINRYLRGVRADRRRMFVLRYWYAAPVEDIARAMACSAGTVKSTLFRMRGELRTYLEKEGFSL